MSFSGLNGGNRSSPPPLLLAQNVCCAALDALLLGALVTATVDGLLLRGPKYPRAFGSGIVAMMKSTSVFVVFEFSSM
jgi:hypothetical protein